MTVGRICIREVDYAEAEESVQEAASRMHDRKIGTLVVLNKDKQPVGMITDRDLALRVVREARDATQTTVGDVMTECPKTVGEETAIENALSLMRAGAFRRVPVVDSQNRVVGILSLDDILDLLCEEFGIIRGLLSAESPSSLPRS
jgi:CBS domain-containing protein